LTSVTIPNSVVTIEEWAFSNNQLTSVTIPNSVTTIGASAFANNQLTGVTIGNSVTSIGDNAFYGNRLTGVIIGNSVTAIGTGAFVSNQLTSISIGANVTLGDNSFPNNFVTNYRINNRRAGVYTYNPTDSNGRRIEYWTCGLRPEASESERKEFESAQAGAQANREAVAARAEAERKAAEAEQKAAEARAEEERKAAEAWERERERERAQDNWKSNRARWYHSNARGWVWLAVLLGGGLLAYFLITSQPDE